MTQVSAALIWNNGKFLICRRPKHKARGLLWEFVGGKVEAGETGEQALLRECREELGITVAADSIFTEVTHEYPDISIKLTLFNAHIEHGDITLFEHCEAKWISPNEIPYYPFCPADKKILDEIIRSSNEYIPTENRMETVTLGKTGIMTPKNAFGALPIQRVSDDYAVMLLEKAYDAGITFFDTARAYSDSEKKLGLAFSDRREKVFIATKTMAKDREGFFRDLETSLNNLKTDYIDIYQFHNPSFCPKPGDGTGLYEAMLEAKEAGKIRHIGITNHRLNIAEEAVKSGLYETLQFPFCYLASDNEIALVELCKNHDVGFIAMKALSGGLITRSDAAYAYIARFDNVLPIWGIQRESELDEFLSYNSAPPKYDGEIREFIEKDRNELIGSFCRGCGYCMPCPAGIEINNCARMSQLIRRSPSAGWLTDESIEKMMAIENCIGCGMCKSKCPYGLDTPALLKKNLEDYKNILLGKTSL